MASPHPSGGLEGAFCHRQFIFRNRDQMDMCRLRGWCGCHHQLEGLEMGSGALQPERIASQNLGRRPKEKIPLPNRGKIGRAHV